MTKIYNRRKFFELAEKKFLNSKENLYAIMIDIDKFKDINDTYGHPVGDKVIKKVTETISGFVQKGSIFGRIGGEEFAIICSSISKDAVVEILELIRKSVEESSVLLESGERVSCTISEGFACVTKEHTSLDALLKEADVALYEAKGSGRNRVMFR